MKVKTSISISSDGYYIAVGTDGAVNLFNISSSTPIWSYPTFSGPESINIYSIAISKDGKYIAAGAQNGTLFLFNRTHSKPVWKNPTGSNIYSIKISANGEYIVSCNSNQIILFNRTSANPLWNYSSSIEYYFQS